MGSDAANRAVIQHDNLIRILYGRDTLGNDNLGGIGNLLPESLPDHGVRMGIHRAGGIVQNQDSRLLQQGSGNTETLLLSAGHIAAALLNPGVILLREALDKFIGAGQLTDADQLLIAGVLIAPAQVFLDGAGKQHVLLKHHGHLIPEGIQVVIPDVDAAYPDASSCYVIQSGDQLYQCRLGASGAAQDPYSLAGFDFQIDMIQIQITLIVPIAEGYVVKGNGTVGNLCNSLLLIGQAALFI